MNRMQNILTANSVVSTDNNTSALALARKDNGPHVDPSAGLSVAAKRTSGGSPTAPDAPVSLDKPVLTSIASHVASLESDFDKVVGNASLAEVVDSLACAWELSPNDASSALAPGDSENVGGADSDIGFASGETCLSTTSATCKYM